MNSKHYFPNGNWKVCKATIKYMAKWIEEKHKDQTL